MEQTALVEVVEKGRFVNRAKASLYDVNGQLLGRTILFKDKAECVDHLNRYFPGFRIDEPVKQPTYVLVD